MRWFNKHLNDFFKIVAIVVIVAWSIIAYRLSCKLYEAFSEKIFHQEEIVVFVDKTPKKVSGNKKTFTSLLFDNTDPYYKDIVTKKEFVKKIRTASAIKVTSSTTADLTLVSMLCVILFLFWAIPILILLLAAIYLRGTKVTPLYDP